jgi:hypothetical protein
MKSETALQHAQAALKHSQAARKHYADHLTKARGRKAGSIVGADL